LEIDLSKLGELQLIVSAAIIHFSIAHFNLAIDMGSAVAPPGLQSGAMLLPK